MITDRNERQQARPAALEQGITVAYRRGTTYGYNEYYRSRRADRRKRPCGLSAGIFTGRAGLDTLIVNDGDPILRRNAHLENYPGFPAGVNSRLLLEMMDDHAKRAGCQRRETRIKTLEPTDAGFAETVDMGYIKEGYYTGNPEINPKGLIAVGPDLNYTSSTDRDRLPGDPPETLQMGR